MVRYKIVKCNGFKLYSYMKSYLSARRFFEKTVPSVLHVVVTKGLESCQTWKFWSDLSYDLGFQTTKKLEKN